MFDLTSGGIFRNPSAPSSSALKHDNAFHVAKALIGLIIGLESGLLFKEHKFTETCAAAADCFGFEWNFPVENDPKIV